MNSIVLATRSGSANPSTHLLEPFVGYFSPYATVTAAYGEKYPTKGSRKWVEGFAEPERVVNTIEFIPD